MKKILMVLSLVSLVGCGVRDDTDPPNGISGLNVFTDHLTGCQYLKAGLGGLTPRMDQNGKQICNKTGGA